jgi:hypothetical protein
MQGTGEKSQSLSFALLMQALVKQYVKIHFFPISRRGAETNAKTGESEIMLKVLMY